MPKNNTTTNAPAPATPDETPDVPRVTLVTTEGVTTVIELPKDKNPPATEEN